MTSRARPYVKVTDPKVPRGIVVYLFEFRNCLIHCLLALASVFLISFYFSQDIYHYLALPLLNKLAGEQNLIAIQVISPVFVPLKLAFYFALFITIPFIFYKLWNFVSPALYQRERKSAIALLLCSIFLFYIGIVFTYFIVLPTLLGFFAKMAPTGVQYMPDISAYLDFSLKLFFVFGLVFEVPILSVLAVTTGIMTISELSHKRRYIIVAAFVIGMLVTPPDVISQIFFASIFWILFELGILCAYLLSVMNKHK